MRLKVKLCLIGILGFERHIIHFTALSLKKTVILKTEFQIKEKIVT